MWGLWQVEPGICRAPPMEIAHSQREREFLKGKQ